MALETTVLNKIAVFMLLVIAAFVFAHRALANGSVLRYLDAHPDQTIVPEVEYYLAESYYFIQNTDQASVYFLRVNDRYPKSKWADDAYFGYIQCLEDSPAASRATLAQEYQKYLDRFPLGKNISVAQNRMDIYRNGESR